MVRDIVAAHDRLNVLVNNAGIAVYDAVHDCSTENWRRVLGVHSAARSAKSVDLNNHSQCANRLIATIGHDNLFASETYSPAEP